MLRWNPLQPPEDGLPPADVRLTELSAEPWTEDYRRVRISLALTPFQQPPNLEVTVLGADNFEASTIYMVELIDTHITFTMHLRDGGVHPPYVLQARVLYPDLGIVDELRSHLTLPGTGEETPSHD